MSPQVAQACKSYLPWWQCSHAISCSCKAVAAWHLPFVQASLVILRDEADGTVCNIFDDMWCLWDTGTYCTMILSHYLHPGATGGHETGFTSLEIMYTPFSHFQVYHWPFAIRSAGNRRLQSPFDPELLNQADFIILSQQVRQGWREIVVSGFQQI